jgi:hypothetical protein
MQTPRFQFPDLETLRAGLTLVFNGNGFTDGQVTVLDREPFNVRSTFPSEIVTCRLDNGSEPRLYCKYSADLLFSAYGHRGGVSYEAKVYQNALRPLPLSTPAFYGAHKDLTGNTWLILEFLDKSVGACYLPNGMNLSARWLGRFHAANEARYSTTPMSFLKSYDAEYYIGWVHRTLSYARQSDTCFQWLETLCKTFQDSLPSLLSASQTLIHGEYYPGNILFRSGDIYPVDWESAAIAVGEIDLASLADGWNEGIVRECQLEYQQARWPNGRPSNFETIFDLSRIYWHFRWLGDKPHWPSPETRQRRFKLLRSAAERLSLV